MPVQHVSSSQYGLEFPCCTGIDTALVTLAIFTLFNDHRKVPKGPPPKMEINGEKYGAGNVWGAPATYQKLVTAQEGGAQ